MGESRQDLGVELAAVCEGGGEGWSRAGSKTYSPRPEDDGLAA